MAHEQRKQWLYIINQGDHDGERWKGDPLTKRDIEDLRTQIREQLREDVPVVALPAGAWLTTVELYSPPEPEKKAAASTAPIDYQI